MSDLVVIQGLQKHFDGIVALDDFSMSVGRAEIIGLIGPNGAGKTTLFNVISGFLPINSGYVTFNERPILGLQPHRIANIGIGRTFQHVRLISRLTVLEHLLLCFKKQIGERFYNNFFRKSEISKQETVNRSRANAILEKIGLYEKSKEYTDSLSYGQQKLLAFGCCLAMDPELLLLDEPIAGIAPEMSHKILALIAELPDEGKSVVIIEHNVDAVANLSDRLVFIDTGKLLCEGQPSVVLKDPQVIKAYTQ